MTDHEVSLAMNTIGRDVLGPAFCVYVHRVIERSRSLDLQRLMFLAREGHLFKTLYDRLAGPLGCALPTSYLYVSRLSTALPAVHGYGLRELRIVARRTAVGTPRDLLRTFGLAEDALLPRIYAAGFLRADEVITDWWADTRVDRLLEDRLFQELVDQQAVGARSLLRAYLDQERYFVDRIGLVDVGWGGTIQDALARAFRGEKPLVHGLYFGVNSSAATYGDRTQLDTKEGLFTDFRRHVGVHRTAVFSFVELFEQAARASHGTTLAYRAHQGRVEPVLKEQGRARTVERASDVHIAALQDGILAFTEDYLRDPPRWAVDRLEPAWRVIDRVVFTPSRTELDAISHLSHTADWGGEGHMSLQPPMSFRPRMLKRTFDKSYWKGGFLRRLGGPMLPRLYRRYLASKD